MNSPLEQQYFGTGIAGLDLILGGGWPAGGSYLVQGEAGGRKTTVGLQFLIEGAARGNRCTFISLSESEAELRQGAQSHGWNLDGIDVVDLSGMQAATTSGSDYSVFTPDEVELTDLMDRIRGSVDETQPHRLVLDPISGIRMLSGSANRYRQQVLGLKDFLRARGVTALILSDCEDSEMHSYLETAVRGVLRLRQELSQYADARRFLVIRKMRGTSYQGGEHPFRILTGGITVFPRVEASNAPHLENHEVVESGIEGLDRLLGGGVERGSVAVISGQSGVGKTTLALQFLTQVAVNGGGARVFSLDESPTSMLHRADSLGMPASEMAKKGLLKLQRLRSTDIYPVEFVRIVQSAVMEDDVQAVLIDSLSAYRSGPSGESHLIHHLSQLLDNLSDAGITTFLTLEGADLTSLSITDTFGVSYLSDNAIVLRFFEAGGMVRRAISVLKKRSGPHESTIREVEFGPEGIRVGAPLSEFNGILTGTPNFIGESRSLLSGENDVSES